MEGIYLHKFDNMSEGNGFMLSLVGMICDCVRPGMNRDSCFPRPHRNALPAPEQALHLHN